MFGRLILRVLLIWLVSFGFVLLWSSHWVLLRLRRVPVALRQSTLGRYLAGYCRLLGATFVKAGQILSTRSDLASDALRKPLSVLHDRVGPFKYSEVRRTLLADFGEPPEVLFEALDPYPVASASVAQVHRGQLHDGRHVAVKVLRPKVRVLVSCDLWLMRLLARIVAIVPRLRPLDPVAAVGSFADAIWQQLDLAIEARNNREFSSNFEGTNIAVPALVDQLCSSSVMTMEFVEGKKILAEDWEQPEHIVRTGFQMVLQMIFADGFIHADLHPGNMFVIDGGRKLVLVDLGLVARLSERHREGMTRLLMAWASRDVSSICTGISQVAFYGQPPKDPTRLEQEVSTMLERYRDVSLEGMEVGRLLNDIIQLVRDQWSKLDPAMAMMALAIGVVEGVAKQLAPHIHLVDEALPFIQGMNA